jgi:hypothetical protein
MKKMPPVTSMMRKDGLLEIDIDAASDWECFDKLIQFLEMYYSAEVKSSIDGPGERVAKLEIRGSEIILYHDDFFGNSLRAGTVGANDIIKIIADDFKEKFRSIE